MKSLLLSEYSASATFAGSVAKRWGQSSINFELGNKCANRQVSDLSYPHLFATEPIELQHNKLCINQIQPNFHQAKTTKKNKLNKQQKVHFLYFCQVLLFLFDIDNYAVHYETFPMAFKVLMPNGMASRKEAVSATAWAISTPKKPSSQLPRNRAGIRKMPCRDIAMTVAGTV